MASQSRETRQKQLAEGELKLQKRLAFLGEKGFDEKKIARDVLVKELKAKIKESQVRLRAIGATEKRTGELAAMKAERLAKSKEEAPKAKKAAEPPPETKPKKKKKKEESAEPQQA
jgi:anthranilate phosphoribosyltransferase